MPKKIVTEVADLAADSPLSATQIREMNRRGELGAALAAMTPRERVGAAAELALHTGKDVSQVQNILARLMTESDSTPPPADGVRRLSSGAYAVASENRPRTFYTVSPDFRACSCPDHTFRHRQCKHIRRAAGFAA